MVIDMLGPSLDHLFEFCGRRFSLKTICMVAIEMLCRIEYMHDKELIHRDIKPQNFLLGVGKKSHMVYAIDFGLAKRYIDPKTGKHNPHKFKNTMAGTVRYLSLNAHLQFEQSRRDDIESIGYVLAYFLREGHLPWMGIKAKKKEKNELQLKAKQETTFEQLYQGHPEEFILYMKYSRSLEYD
jgi:serine/threonine protein kinase